MDCCLLKLAIILQNRPLPLAIFLAFAPPRVPLAHFLLLEDETLGLDDVEEQFSDHRCVRRVCHLQARAEPGFRCEREEIVNELALERKIKTINFVDQTKESKETENNQIKRSHSKEETEAHKLAN